MNIEKIEINGHYVWADKDAEIKLNDYYVFLAIDSMGEKLTIGVRLDSVNDSSYYDCKKIISASPELHLKGVPTYVEWLAEKEYPTFNLPLSITTGIHNFNQEGFIKGYQTAEKELPTWDDVRKAIELSKYNLPTLTTTQIIEQLKKDKQ